MRCKKHISDRSSSVGVCASCLRDRLFTLIAAQAQANEDRRKSESHPPPQVPPPLIFPRSVSPYICRRSDDSSWNQNQTHRRRTDHDHHSSSDVRFYSTPQLGPTSNSIADVCNINRASSAGKHKKSKFSLLSNLFRSSSRSSDTIEPDPGASTVSRASLSTSTSSPASSTWLSSVIPGRRKKQSRLFSHDDTVLPPPTTTHHRSYRTRDRGMSPSCEDEDYTEKEGSPSVSGYSSESSQGWRKSATTTPAQPPRRRGLHNRNISSIAFCLSPLVRASPNSHRGQSKDNVTPGISGEIGRVPNINGGNNMMKKKPHLSTAASFCANRSRKLADFGRYNNNYSNP